MAEVEIDWMPSECLAWKWPPEQSVSEWAEAHIEFPARESHRRGRFAPDPWQREILDSYGADGVHFLTVVAPTQVGKTALSLVMIGYTIAVEPGSILLVMPREPDAEERLETRIKPLIEATPALARLKPTAKSDWKKDRVTIGAMDLWTGGANSPAALADKPLPIVVLDEVAKFPPQTGKEADAVKLADNRNKTFGHRRKRIAISSPTVSTDLIMREFGKSDRREYVVPCPECGDYAPLTWDRIKWPKDVSPDEIREGYLAWCECLACGHQVVDDVTQSGKHALLEAGLWCPEGCEVVDGEVRGEPLVAQHRGYQVRGTMGHATSWSELAAQFRECGKDRTQLMDFFNGGLGEPFDEELENTSEDRIKANAVAYRPRTVPDGVRLLTAGVDCGEHQQHYVVRGWGADERSWLIEHGSVAGLDEIHRHVIDGRWGDMQVERVCIDSGYKPDPVYRLARDWPDRVAAVKGKAELGSTGQYFSSHLLDKLSDGKVDRYGLVLYMLGTNALQAKLNRLINGREGSGWHVYGGEIEGERFDVGDDYRRHMVAESLMRIGKKWEWRRRPGYGSPHFRDCERYALAAALMLRVWELRSDVPEPTGETMRSAGGGFLDDAGSMWESGDGWLDG